MRSFALAAILVSATLVACVSGVADDEESTEQDIHAPHLDASVSDGGVAVTDASVPTSDGGIVVVTDGSAPPTDAAASDVPTYAEIAPKIAAACGGCHHTSFNTLDKVKANKTRMLGMITSGRMPKNNPGWKNTADGLDVIDFLANSPELQ
jgi:cytochrome c553